MAIDRRITQHFTLAEMVASVKAEQLGIDNTPTAEVVQHLITTAEMLERIRAAIRCPIIVTSGYRCPALNKAVGGVTSSDHTTGCAADIVAPSFGTPTELARLLSPLVSVLGIQQLILEGIKGKQWVHVSTRAPAFANNRILTINDAGAVMGIVGLA